MKRCRLFVVTLCASAALGGFAVESTAAGASDSNDSTAATAGDDLYGTIATLLGDKDKDIRALGLQQVREAAKGTKATQQFAALLPKLPAEAQIGLLDALADRGDKAARPAVLELLKSGDPAVREAAIRALGSIGEAADMPRLVQLLAAGSSSEQAAARASLGHLPGQAVDTAIAGELHSAAPAIRAELIQILATRRALGTIPNLLAAAQDSDATVRKAAMAALGELAGPADVAAMLRGVLKAEPGAEREAAERAVWTVCKPIGDPAKRDAAALAGWQDFSAEQQTALLPTLGGIGGGEILRIVEAAIADHDPRRSDAGIRAICNWPDATVAHRLLELLQSTTDRDRQRMLLHAMTRVAVLHDSRSDAERLNFLKTCRNLSSNDDERNYVLKRAAAVRTIESLRFLLPYLDQPALAQEACASIVELAHHRELRLPHEAEFNQALDRVIRICKDPSVMDHATRYRQNKT